MNEQIEKLIKECEDFGDWENKNYSFDKEKFAELIVQECVDWIDGSPSTDAGQLVLTKSFIIANIKEHFGVE